MSGEQRFLMALEMSLFARELAKERIRAEHPEWTHSRVALEAHTRQSLFNVIDLATGWKIDLIIRKSRAFSQEEFGRRQLVNVQGLPLFVASAEDVVIAKLEWSKLAQSQRQIEDVAAILRLRWEVLDGSYLERWISELDLKQEWSNAKRMAEIAEST